MVNLKKMSGVELAELISEAQVVLSKKQATCDHLYKHEGVGDPGLGGTMFSEWFQCTKCGHERNV